MPKNLNKKKKLKEKKLEVKKLIIIFFLGKIKEKSINAKCFKKLINLALFKK